MATKKITKFDMAEYLENDAMIAEYLKTVMLKISKRLLGT